MVNEFINGDYYRQELQNNVNLTISLEPKD